MVQSNGTRRGDDRLMRKASLRKPNQPECGITEVLEDDLNPLPKARGGNAVEPRLRLHLQTYQFGNVGEDKTSLGWMVCDGLQGS
jgi:hypothetical protein